MSTFWKVTSSIFGGKLFKGDRAVWMVYFFLCMISLVEVYSASSRLTFSGGSHWEPMLGQACCLLGGLLIIVIVLRIGCKWFMIFPFFLMPLSLILLTYTSVLGLGSELNGTHRWINLGFITIQPSEIAKVSLIIYTAMVLAKTQAERIDVVNGIKVKTVGAFKGKRSLAYWLIIIPTAIICGLIFSDNVSTSLMLGLVIFIMMWVGHIPKDYMLKTTGAVIALAGLLLAVSLVMPDEALNSNFMTKRLTTVKHRVMRMAGHEDSSTYKVQKTDKQKKLDDKNSQKTYAYIAIANSNVIGRGPGNSIQRDFLQHAESDFIYAIIIEELGIFGMIFVPFLYFVLLIRCVRIAQRCTAFFPAFLVIGSSVMIVLQAMVNMGVAVIPGFVTGQTLPLISKGGSSIFVTSFYFGMILSVSRFASKKDMKAPMTQAVPDGETSDFYDDKPML